MIYKIETKKKEGIWFFVSMEKAKDLAASSKRVIYQESDFNKMANC